MARGQRRVIWTEEALRALDEVLEYIAKDAPEGARLVLQQALAAASSLATLSERGRVVSEIDVTQTDILELYKRLTRDFKICSTDLLNAWGDKKAYSLAQGQ